MLSEECCRRSNLCVTTFPGCLQKQVSGDDNGRCTRAHATQMASGMREQVVLNGAQTFLKQSRSGGKLCTPGSKGTMNTMLGHRTSAINSGERNTKLLGVGRRCDRHFLIISASNSCIRPILSSRRLAHDTEIFILQSHELVRRNF